MQTQQQTARNFSARETCGLIGSDMVEGMAVYRPNGERIGTIERVMIDKRNGKIRYAVMSFGGFLGMGNDHYPIPWSLLVYNERLSGYEVGVSDEQLHGAPRFPARDPWMFGDRQNEAALYAHYGALPYW
jgi:PRC-barrel domain